MMTPQEIIKQIRLLPKEQRKKIKDSIPLDDSELSEKESKEQKFLESLYSEGIIGNIPNPDKYNDEDDDFEPIEINGKPTSEIIIEDRY